MAIAVCVCLFFHATCYAVPSYAEEIAGAAEPGEGQDVASLGVEQDGGDAASPTAYASGLGDDALSPDPGAPVAAGEGEAGEAAAPEGPDAVAAAPGGGRAVAAESSAPALEGSAHVQRMGWVRGAASADGTLTLGTTGMALRLEAIRLAVAGAPAGSVSVRAHVQTYGWRPYAPDGAGTTGESKRLEAVRIRLEGELARDWSVQYRVHSQTLGWLGWAADGQAAGTGGMSKRLESVQVRLVPAGAPLPAGGDAYVDAGLSAEAHVQGVGWQGARRGMDVTVGTSGQSRRMEALRLSRPSFDLSGDVECQAHVQGIGWQGWVGSGRVAGTTGQGRRVEAVRVRLTGELDSHYDVWYRLHVQRLGWMAWARDGEPAGTAGLSLRVEAAQVAIVPEGAPAPPADGQAASVAFAGPGTLSAQVSGADGSWTPWDSSGSALSAAGALRRVRAELSGPLPGEVRVEAHSARRGWLGAAAQGEAAGDEALDLQAVRISLTDEASRAYSVWYRAEVEGLGWTGWAADGAEAGSVGLGRPLVALQACLRSRAQGAPGPTTQPLITTLSPYELAQSLSDANALQRRLVNSAKTTPWAGSGLCAAWVQDVYENAGLGKYWGNACDLYDMYCTSSDFSELKAGMIIAVRTHNRTSAGSIWGHVGVYIGDGKVMHNVTASVTTVSLEYWCEFYGTTYTPKWGWLGNTNVA